MWGCIGFVKEIIIKVEVVFVILVILFFVRMELVLFYVVFNDCGRLLYLKGGRDDLVFFDCEDVLYFGNLLELVGCEL